MSALVVVAACAGTCSPWVHAVPRPGTDGPPPSMPARPAPNVTIDLPCLSTVSATGGETSDAATSTRTVPEAAHRYGTGQGQTVAIIDTGVNPGPAFPRLRGAGDFVADRDGLTDCDAHGTLVAGIVGASGTADGYTGVAPGVELVSIRQSSSVFRQQRPPTDTGRQAPQVALGDGVGTISTLAWAVRAAADSGATVINISEVACVPAGTALADQPLGAALRYATDERDIVVVAAAGNATAACPNDNDDRPLADDDTTNGWETVRTVATPAWYDDHVLTVAAVDETGQAADFSLRGPWVDVAAPGVAVRSVGAHGTGYADRIVQHDGQHTTLSGTSFAAPYVAGVVALVRQAHPELNARQVSERIQRTAVPPAGGHNFSVGYGTVDPVYAITAVAPPIRPPPRSIPLAEAPNVAVSYGPGVGGVIALGILTGGMVALTLAGLVRRR